MMRPPRPCPFAAELDAGCRHGQKHVCMHPVNNTGRESSGLLVICPEAVGVSVPRQFRKLLGRAETAVRSAKGIARVRSKD